MLGFIKGLKSKFCSMLWTILGLEALVVIYLLTPPPIEPMVIIEDTFASIKGDNYMVESSGKASYTVSVNKNLEMDLNVTIAYGGVAKHGVDFSGPTMVVIKEGELSANFDVVGLNDNLKEGSETFTVKIANVTGKTFLDEFKPHDRAGVVYTKIEDESVPVRANGNTAELRLVCAKDLNENGQSITCQMSLSQKALEDINIVLDYSGSAEYGVDYNAAKNIQIKKGASSVSFNVKGLDDFIRESGEEIIIKVHSVDDVAFEDIRFKDATAAIIMHDEKVSKQPIKLLLSGNKDVIEGNTTNYTLTLSEPALEDVTVYFDHSDNTDDFVVVEKVIIAKGEKEKTFSIASIDDNTKGKNGFIVYSVAKVEQNGFEKVSYSNTAVKTKIKDETVPTNADAETAYISLNTEADNRLYLEDNKQIKIIAAISQVAQKDVVVKLAYNGQAALGKDFSAGSKLIIKKGQSEGSLFIMLNDDNTVEGAESLNVAISSHGDGGLEDVRVKEPLQLSIDDEKPPEANDVQTATVGINCPSSLFENREIKTCKVALSQTALEDITVMLAYSGSAEHGVDYEAVQSVIVKKGKRSATFTITALDDVLKEGAEEIVVTLDDVKQMLFEDLRLIKQAEHITLNDERKPTQAITLTLEADKTVIEGQRLTYTLTLSQVAVKDVEVALMHSKNSSDLSAVEHVTIPAGQKSVNFEVETTDDNVVEKNDFVVYSIAKVKQQGFEKLVANKKAVKSKIVDEEKPTHADNATAYITLHIDSEPVSEDAKRAKITAKLSQKAQKDLFLTLIYSGQGKLGQDFKVNDKVTIKKGSTEGSIYLYPVNDNLLEGSESVVIDIAKHGNGGLEDVRVKETLTASIVDEKESKNSPKASVRLSGPTKVSEPSLSKPYTVQIDQKANDEMVVSLAYTGSADSSDYSAVTNVTIPKSADSVTFAVQTLDDNATEDLEAFTVSIAKVEGGGLENVVVLPNVVKTALSDEIDIAKEFERIVSDQVIEFDSGSREINKESKKPLDKIAALLKRYTKAKIVIQGHTNSVGNASYNKRLSQDRAVSIRVYLVSQGVSKRRIKAMGYGSTRPLLAEDHPEALEVNRRVEFKVVY